MNSNFNQQFIMLDFKLLENKDFLQFLGSSEFATYLVLRRFVWRSVDPHYMGLHTLYRQQQKLVCSLERDTIAEFIDIAPDNISRHLSKLQDRGVIKRILTGRQSVFVLGEWIDVNGDGSYKVEWFYMEGIFGLSKPDLTLSVRSDLTQLPSDQTRLRASEQNQPKTSDNNKQINRKENKQQQTVVALLKKWKVAEKKARELTEQHEPQYIEKKVSLLEWKLSNPSYDKPIKDAAGWLVQAIEQDYQPSEEFSKEQRRQKSKGEYIFDSENNTVIIKEQG